MRQYEVFEALFKHYHVTKGSLRYANAAADNGSGGSWFLSKLWRNRRVAHEAAEQAISPQSPMISP